MEERSYTGFLHRHPGMELKKGLSFEEHVIVDRQDWEIARQESKESPGTASNIAQPAIVLLRSICHIYYKQENADEMESIIQDTENFLAQLQASA